MSDRTGLRQVTSRVLCLGNRYVEADDVGSRVHDELQAAGLPPCAELVDGGIAGLNLLRWFDGVERVIVVDALEGFGAGGTVHELDGGEVAAMEAGGFGHGSGLSSLLRMAEIACEGATPKVVVVGVETPADGASVREAARRVLRMVGSGGAEAGQREWGQT
jgi:hydrogenase maturation protease